MQVGQDLSSWVAAVEEMGPSRDTLGKSLGYVASGYATVIFLEELLVPQFVSLTGPHAQKFGGLWYIGGVEAARPVFYAAMLGLFVSLVTLFAVHTDDIAFQTVTTTSVGGLFLSVFTHVGLEVGAPNGPLNLWLGFEPLFAAVCLSAVSVTLRLLGHVPSRLPEVSRSEVKTVFRHVRSSARRAVDAERDSWQLLAVVTGYTVVSVGTLLVADGLVGVPGLTLAPDASGNTGVDYLLHAAETSSQARDRLVTSVLVGLACLALVWTIDRGTPRVRWGVVVFVGLMGLPALHDAAPVADASAAAALLLFVSALAEAESHRRNQGSVEASGTTSQPPEEEL